MTGLFDYNTSPLNPLLKIIISALYVYVAYAYYSARKKFDGDLDDVLGALFLMGIIASGAALARYFGHGTEFGFTKAYSLKWFESLGYVIQGTLFVYAGRKLARGIIPVVKE
jgi:hypothetical protein